MKPPILLELDLFTEDLTFNTKEIISRHFDIREIDLTKAMLLESSGPAAWRHSLNIAQMDKQKAKSLAFSDCLKWVPHLRKHMLFPSETYFNELSYFLEYKGSSTFPIFLRPCNGFKTFSGQIFSEKRLAEEVRFLQQNKNVGPDLLCMYSPATVIAAEWRCIFIDGKYCSGSQYMTTGHIDLSPEVPADVIAFAEAIAANPFFTNNNLTEFCVDVGRSYMKLYLIEINSFNCSSFYAADLNKIYETWAHAFTKDTN